MTQTSLTRFVEAIQARGPDGKPTYERRDLLSLLPLLLQGMDPTKPQPEGLSLLIEESAALLGITVQSSPAEVAEKIKVACLENPRLHALRTMLQHPNNSETSHNR